jgi:hypothetical protein
MVASPAARKKMRSELFGETEEMKVIISSSETCAASVKTLSRALMVSIIVGMALMAHSASAQAVYGSIVGTATDNTGAIVQNADITVTDVAKGTLVKAQTNDSGQYTVQHLIPDTYKVEATAPGFSKTTVDNILVYADTAPKVDIQLSIGEVSNSVTVTSAAPLLETDRADVSTVLDDRALVNLPNLNRNFTAFELLTPGTTYTSSSLSGAPFFGAAGGPGFGSGGFAGTDVASNYSIAGGGDYVLSAKWLIDFRFGYYRIHVDLKGLDFNQPLGNKLGIPNANVGDLALNGGLPQFSIEDLYDGLYGTTAGQLLQNTSQ